MAITVLAVTVGIALLVLLALASARRQPRRVGTADGGGDVSWIHGAADGTGGDGTDACTGGDAGGSSDGGCGDGGGGGGGGGD